MFQGWEAEEQPFTHLVSLFFVFRMDSPMSSRW
jgi:hypothetical protein